MDTSFFMRFRFCGYGGLLEAGFNDEADLYNYLKGRVWDDLEENVIDVYQSKDSKIFTRYSALDWIGWFREEHGIVSVLEVQVDPLGDGDEVKIALGSSVHRWEYGEHSGSLKQFNDARRDVEIDWDEEAPEDASDIEVLVITEFYKKNKR